MRLRILAVLSLAGCAAPMPTKEELPPAAVELLIVEGAALQRVQEPRDGVLTTRIDEKVVALAPAKTDVKARLTLYVATVTVTQQYHNSSDRAIDAVYSFPLPDDAGVRDFVLQIGERRLRGIIREREEARKIYREARRQGFVTTLLTRDRTNSFTQSVANIGPGQRIDVQITYLHALRYAAGMFEFFFPRIAADLALEVTIDAGAEIADLTSTHPIRVEGTKVTLDGNRDGDFVLRYRIPARTSFAASDGYFVLMIQPPSDVADLRIDWGALEAKDVYPRELPDLVAGRPMIVIGRCGRGPAKVRLTGRSAAGPFELSVDARDTPGNGAPATLWARAKMASLTSPEEIRKIALQHGLVSDWTAFVTVDSMTREEKKK